MMTQAKRAQKTNIGSQHKGGQEIAGQSIADQSIAGHDIEDQDILQPAIHTEQIKARIAKQFGRAAGKYNDAAQVQLDIAFDALQLLGDEPLGITLDIGCGTGRISQMLVAKSSHLLALDLAEGMCRYASDTQRQSAQLTEVKKTTWLTADAESIPVKSASIDTVFSSMALQWCVPINLAMAEIYRVLKPGGNAVLALLCKGSMSELKDSWQSIDRVPHVNQFQAHQVIVDSSKHCGFNAKASTHRYTTWHCDAKAALNSIKSIGANVVPSTGNQTRLCRNTLAELQHVYANRHAQNGQLPLGYQVSFLRLHKPLSSS